MNKKLFLLAALSALALTACPAQNNPTPDHGGDDSGEQGGGEEGGGEEGGGEEEATVSVALNKTSVSLGIGLSETLVATVTPDDLDEKGVTWTSNKPAVVTVDENGNINGLKAGDAVITATSKKDPTKSAACAVKVARRFNLAHEFSEAGHELVANIHINAGVKDVKGTAREEAEDHKVIINENYSFIEDEFGIAYLAEEIESVEYEGYYLFEKTEGGFEGYWGKYYDNKEDYAAHAYLDSLNQAISTSTASDISYTSSSNCYTSVGANVNDGLFELLYLDYMVGEDFPAIFIYPGETFRFDVCSDRQDKTSVQISIEIESKHEAYAELDEFLATAGTPFAPVSGDDVGMKAFVETGVYTERYQTINIFSDVTFGPRETVFTPFTKTTHYQDFDWSDEQWDVSEILNLGFGDVIGVKHEAVQMTETGFTYSTGEIFGSEDGYSFDVTPADFAEVKFEEDDLDENWDWGVYAEYYNPSTFAYSGFFDVAQERFVPELGMSVYSLKPGDRYYGKDSETGEKVEKELDQDMLKMFADVFGVFYNMADYVNYWFEPVEVKSLNFVPVYAEGEAETAENLVSVEVYLVGKYVLCHYEKDEETGDYKKVIDDFEYNNKIFVDSSEYTDFGLDYLDPFYRVSGLKDVAYLYEIYEDGYELIKDGMEFIPNEKAGVMLRTNVLGDVEVKVADEQNVATCEYNEEFDAYIIEGKELGETTLTVTGGEVADTYDIDVIALLELTGTFTVTIEGVEYTLVLTEGEDGKINGTLNGATVEFGRYHNTVYVVLDSTRTLVVDFESTTEYEGHINVAEPEDIATEVAA